MGSIDFSYGHSLEITFEDVYHLSVNRIWRTDTSKPVLKLVEGEEAFSLNKKYSIEQGNVLFKIIPEDINTAFYIAAKGISYNTDKVYYYKKDNLAPNERIADWVKQMIVLLIQSTSFLTIKPA
jgi:hypothetical protein